MKTETKRKLQGFGLGLLFSFAVAITLIKPQWTDLAMWFVVFIAFYDVFTDNWDAY